MEKSNLHILVLGGDGGLSGVPKYLSQVGDALGQEYRLTFLSGPNKGGYDFANGDGFGHIEVPEMSKRFNPFAFVRGLINLDRAISKTAPDIIWANARSSVLMARVLAGLSRLTKRNAPPLIVTFHGLPFGAGHRPVIGAVSLMLERFLCRVSPSSELIFLSEFEKSTFVARVGSPVRKHRTTVIRNCSTLGAKAKSGPSDRLRILVCARHSYQKNLAAAAALMAHLPDHTEMVLCGDGTGSADLRAKFVHHLGESRTGSKVQFHGAVKDMRPQYENADLFLITSRYEGTPIVALEAFEAGLPCVLPDLDSLNDLFETHPFTARIDPNKPMQAAQELVALHNQFTKDRSSAIEQTHQEWEQNYSFKTWSAQIGALIKSVQDSTALSQEGIKRP